jgi:DNA-binding NtrC family response regulator
LKNKDAEAALKNTPCELLSVQSLQQLSRKKSDFAPRLSIVESDVVPNQLTEALKLLRQTWPLADMIVWAPKATGSVVRSAFLAGAKDVVISSSVTRLTETVQHVLHHQQFLPVADELASRRSRASRFESMLSRSNKMWDLFDTCSRVAPSEATVLIVGETGTGKELLARAIHHRSKRGGRFVATNCASITPELVESELFGHQKGAFTGAHSNKQGLVRHADQGTFFLDEIGDMPESAQMSLLRLLQEGKIRPVGGHDEIPVDVRILAATHVSLDEAVARGDFREDLFYRLDVIRMNVPPLRERPEDIVYLFGHFSKQLAKHYGLPRVDVSDGFLEAMSAYTWSGNIRQLENFAERVVLARTQRRLSARDFARLIQHSQSPSRTPSQATLKNAPSSATNPPEADVVDISETLEQHMAPALEKLERQYLEAILQAHQGRIGESAEQAGVSRRTLLRKLKAHRIDKADFKD